MPFVTPKQQCQRTECVGVVKPLSYWTVFTDRVLNTAVCLIWVGSIVITASCLLGCADPPVQRQPVPAASRYQHNVVDTR